ncbi:MAG: CHC2 zinc finger domain-containing protein [Desulfitobacteriaceae bacterium]
MQLYNSCTTKLEQFFKSIFGNETINFNCIHYKTGRTVPSINGVFNAKTIELLEQFNRQYYEIYFVVNSGGYKNRDINKIKAVFIDLDCPKEVTGQLPSLNNVNDFKQQSMNAFNDIRYNIEDVINAVPNVRNDMEHFGAYNKNNNNTLVFIVGTKTEDANINNDNIHLIREQNIDALQTQLNPQPITLNSHSEVEDYLKRQSLHTLLCVKGKFRCIFHDDENPSAGIFINGENGHHIYKCHGCGKTGTIFDVVQNLTGLDFIETARFLRTVYQIQYAETEWQHLRKLILENNAVFEDN